MAIDKYRKQSLADQNKHIREGIIEQMDNDARKIKDAKEYYAKRGSGKFTNEGAEDRLSAVPYNESTLEKHKNKKGIRIISQGDIKSYQYGYYTRSMEKLASIIKYPEIRPNLDIEAIDYNDAQDININIELLPQEVQNCKEYLIGYKKGLKINSKKR
mgnify:FL=1